MPLNVAKALEAGYPMSDIANVLANENRFDIAAARQRGYTDEDIVNALSKIPKPETGFFPGLRAGTEQLKGAVGAIGAAMGVEGAEEYAAEKRRRAAEIYRQPEFTEAPVSYLTGLLGQSIPFMAAPVAAGVAGAAAVPVGASALTTGLAAAIPAGLTSATQFTGTNLERQLAEGKRAQDLEVAKAVAASIPQAALDTLSMRMVPGLGRIFGRAGIEMTEAELNQVARHGLVSGVADKVKAYGPQVLRASGVEGLTESAQQVLERAQAGLSITDEDARKEYFDSFLGGALLGGTIAVPGTYFERGAARERAETERDARLAEERRVEEEKAAAEKAAYESSPEYLLGLEPKLEQLTTRMKELQTARGKKPGRDAEPEEMEAWQTATEEIKSTGEEIRELRREIKKRNAEIAAVKEEAERQGLSPEQYFLRGMGEKPPSLEAAPVEEEAEPTIVDLAERPVLTPEATTTERKQRALDKQLEGLRYFDEITNPEAVARQLARDPALAQAFIDGELTIKELGKKDARLVRSALPLQLKAREEERAARTAEVVAEEKEALERIGANIKTAEDVRSQIDAERYALRNIAQDPSNPVEFNEKLNKLIALLDEKTKPTVTTEAGYGAGALRGRRTAGAAERVEREPLLKLNEETGEYEEVKRPADAFDLTREADTELIRLIEKFRMLQQQKGAARDSAEIADLMEQIRIAALPKRTEVLKDYVNTVPDILQTGFMEKPFTKSSYMAEIDRLAAEQEEAFPAALEAIRTADAFRKNPEVPPITGTITAKPKSPEQRIDEERARLDAEERKTRGRFTTAVLQEIEANRRADAGPSLTKAEANLIAGRLNNTLQTAATRKFGAPEEAMSVIKEDVSKLVQQYSEVEKKGKPVRGKELVKEEQQELFAKEEKAPRLGTYAEPAPRKTIDERKQNLIKQLQARLTEPRLWRSTRSTLENAVRFLEEGRGSKELVAILEDQNQRLQRGDKAVLPELREQLRLDKSVLAEGRQKGLFEEAPIATERATAANFQRFLQSAEAERLRSKKETQQILQEEKKQRPNTLRTLNSLTGRINSITTQLGDAVALVQAAARTARELGKDTPGYRKLQQQIADKLANFAKDKARIEQDYTLLNQYRAQRDQSADALVRVYNNLDRQKRQLEAKRDALGKDTPQARTARKKYTAQITSVDAEIRQVREGFEASGKDVDTAVTQLERKIESVFNFEAALKDNATLLDQPSLTYLRDFTQNSEVYKSFFPAAEKLRSTLTKLQASRAKVISAIAGEKRAAVAIEAGKTKPVGEMVREGEAKAARQRGLGLPGTRVERADIKAEIAEQQEQLVEEQQTLSKMETDRQAMNKDPDATRQEKTGLSKRITAQKRTIAETEQDIKQLERQQPKEEADAKPAPTKFLPAAKQEKAKKAFEEKFGEFKLAEETEEGELPTMAYRRVTPPKFRTAGMEAGVMPARRAGKREIKRVERELDAPDTDAAFSIGKENTVEVDPAQAKALADKIKAGLPKDVKVLYVDKFDNIEDFNKVPGKLISEMGRQRLMSRDEDGVIRAKRVRGAVLSDGTVVIFGSHHATLSELEGTFAHELYGHYGIDMLLGAQGFRRLVKAVEKEHGGIMELAKKFGIEQEVQDAAAYYAELYQKKKRAGASRAELDQIYDKGQVQAMRELIAHIEEAKVDQNLIQKAGTFIKEMVGMLRAGLRKLGLSNLAEASTSDLYYMLRKSRKSFNQREMGVYVNPNNEVAFSRKPAFSGQVSADVAQTVNNVVKGPTSVADRIKSEVTGIAARTAFIDRLAPMERVAEGLKKSTQAMQMLYYGRMYDQRMAWTGATVNGGAPTLKLDTNTGERTILARGGANLKDVADKLAQVKGYGNAEAVRDLFTTYLAAYRAQNKGINKLNFSGNVTAAGLKRVQQIGDSIPQFKDARKIYNEYNSGLMNWLAESGAIDKKLAAALVKDEDYVPFYRAIGDNVVMEIAGSQPITIGNLQTQPYLKDLVGGDQKIQDFFTSSLQNTAMIVDMGLRNLATKEASFSLQEAGLLKPLGKYKGKDTFIGDGHGPAQPNTLRFKMDGRDKYVIVQSEDAGIPSELLVHGLHGVTTTLGGFTKAFAVPARFLRAMVTRNPVYSARQIIRDSTTNFMLTGGNMTPVASAAKEVLSMYAGKSKGEKVLQERGIIGGQLLTGTPEDMQKLMLQLAKGGSGWETALAKLDRMHMSADAAARVTLYNSLRKQGLSDMEATLATLESMNFSKRGTSGSLYALNMVVPFLNAQIQGLNVLYQSFTGKLPYAEKLKVQRKLVARGLMMAAGTLAYAALMEDDEAYKNASLRDRLQNWFIRIPGVDEPIKVPIPFEAGLIFKAIPEAIAMSMSKDEDAGRVLAALGGLAAMSSPVGISTFVPQAAKPLVEATANYQFYNGAPIESEREQTLLPTERTRDKTSGVARLLSGAIGSVTEAVGYPTKGVSPVMIDSVINGYTGGLGLAIAQMIGTVVPKEVGAEGPTKRMSDMPIIGSMFQPVDATGQVTQFYEKAKEYGQIKASFDKMITEGREEEARQFADKYARQISLADVSEDFKQTMSEFTQLERSIRASDMSPDEKRSKLDELRRAKILFATSFNAASRQQ